jgi:hypothetical protein
MTPPVSSPPPKAVRGVLRLATRRLHRLATPARPALHDPTAAMVLFTGPELACLARWNYWPLCDEAIAWLKQSPADRAARRLRREARIAAVAREVLAADLPGALAYLQEEDQ